MELSITIASIFKTWLGADGFLGRLHPNGFAFVALPTDARVLDQLNQDIRVHLPEVSAEAFIIGEDGAGNFFTVQASNPDGEVRFFDHEWKKYVESEVWPSLRGYYEYCIGIEQKSS